MRHALTTLNPNVLYELGLSHGLECPTVLLAQSIDQVPFDLRSYHIQLYSTHYSEIGKLRAALREVGENHLRGHIIFGNPVTDFKTNRGISPIALNEERISNEQEGIGILEATQASQEFARVMSSIAGEINGSVSRISPLLANFDEAIQDNTLTSQAQEIAEQISLELENSSEQLEKYFPEMEENVKNSFQPILRYLTILDAENQDNKQQINNFKKKFSDLSEKLPIALKGLKSYRNSIEQIGLRSEIMGPASRRNIRAVEKIIGSMEQIKALISRTIQVIDEKMKET